MQTRLVNWLTIPVIVMVTFLVMQFEWPTPTTDGITLQAPAFVSEAHAQSGDTPATYLRDEAGISGYVQTSQPIDLQAVKSAFSIIELETDDYLIGLTNHSTHTYIHRDGWIVVYYFAGEPTSKIIRSGGGTGTKFETVIETIAETDNLSYDEVKFYHFEYPDARLMKFVTKVDGTFDITLPSNFTYYEYGWAFRCRSTCYYEYTLRLDGTTLGTTSGLGITRFGTINRSRMEPDVAHRFSLVNSGSTSLGYTIIMLYSEESS